MPKKFTFAAHYGITDYDDNTRGDDYTDWRIGVATEREGFSFALGYTTTSGVAGGCAGNTCDSRLVFIVSRSL